MKESSNTPSLSNEELGKRDYILLIDQSGSMDEKDCPGGMSRWAYAHEQTKALANKCNEFDDDGIDVGVFNSRVKIYNGTTPDKVDQIFKENSPTGTTDTAKAVEAVLDAYRKRYDADNKAKPITLIVVTDGTPTDQKALDQAIIAHTKWMKEDGQTGIQFIQIGKDQTARKALEHLDNELEGQGAAFDIVDTKNEEEMAELSITQLLEMAVTD